MSRIMLNIPLRAALRTALRTLFQKSSRPKWQPLSNERFFLWLPVLFAGGAGLYFYGDTEPSLTFGFSCLLLFGAGFSLSSSPPFKRFCLAVLMACFGLVWAQITSLSVDGVMLKRGIKETSLSGTVIQSEARLRGSLFELDVSHIKALRPEKTPQRLVLYGRTAHAMQAMAGCEIRLKANLTPLSEPAVPRRYDRRLDLHFQKIGGRGFIREMSQVNCPDSPQPLAQIQQWRVQLAGRLKAGMSEKAGGIGVALMTGLRGGISTHNRDVLRASGLAHMLAISGMHMALITGTIYGVLRLFFACFAGFVQRVNVRVICGLAGAAGGSVYLVISGMSVATIRAYVMMLLVFMAIILGRQALTLRNVALAAFVVLLVSPYAILQAGFQMSFAAVIALVAFYETYGRTKWSPLYGKRLGFWAHRRRQMRLYFLALIFTSLIAGAVTGYIGVYHFNYLSTYGLAANLLAVPILAIIIMPAGLLAVLLMPFHLEQYPLALMSRGIEWVIQSAEFTTQPASAIVYFPATPPLGLFSFALGLLIICLLPDKRRWFGLAPILISLSVLGQGATPMLLVHGHLHHLALRQTDGQYQILSRSKKNYVPSRWLIANGQQTSMANDISAMQTVCRKPLCVLANDNVRGAGGVRVARVSNRAALKQACAQSSLAGAANLGARDLVLASFHVSKKDKAACSVTLFDKKHWRYNGVRVLEKTDGQKWQITPRRPESRLWMK